MNRFAFSLALTVALALPLSLGAVATAQAQPSISVSNYGQYQTRNSGKSVRKPRTASGEVSPVSKQRLVRKTTKIFGQLGRSFGVEIDLKGFNSGPVRLTIRTIHPPITNPKTGQTTRVSVYDWDVAGRQGVYFGYTFDYGWELAEGVWVHQFLYKGRLLAQKRFQVVIPLN